MAVPSISSIPGVADLRSPLARFGRGLGRLGRALVMSLSLAGVGTDDTGRGNTATLVSAPATVTGKVGNGLYCSGGSCFTIPGAAAGDIAFGHGDWSICWWAKPTSIAAGTSPWWEKGDSGGVHQELYCQRSGGDIYCYAQDIGKVANTTDAPLVAGQWAFCSLRYRASTTTMELWVNCGEHRTNTTVTTITERGAQLRVGKTYAGNGDLGIDQFQVWQRALSDLEVQAVMNRFLGSSYARVSTLAPVAGTVLSRVTLATGASYYGLTDLAHSAALGLYVAVWREATIHGLTSTGKIRVATSPDGTTWTNRALLTPPIAASDLRDPKVVIRPSDGAVCVYAAQPKADNSAWPMVVFTAPAALPLVFDAGVALTGLTADDWTWRPQWGPDGKAYCVAYTALVDPVTLRLYRSTDGVAWTALVDPLLGPAEVTEAALAWRADGSAVALVREDDGTWDQVGYSAATPWDVWTFTASKPTVPNATDSRIGSPVGVELADTSLLFGGRRFVSIPVGQSTELVWVSRELAATATAVLVGPPVTTTSGSESGYPGLVDLADGTVLMTWGESRDGVTFSVYCARVRLPN